MQILAITSKGIEDIAALEIEEMLKVKPKMLPSAVIFEVRDLKEVVKLAYVGQSFDKLLFLFDYFDFHSEDDFKEKLKKIIEKIDFDIWLDKKATFKASCRNFSSIPSEEISAYIGEQIIAQIKKKKKYSQKVDLEKPDVIFFAYIIENTAYIGVDTTGFEHHKRHYKIFNHPASLRGTIAYALVRISEYNSNELLLDPFCGSGVIPIEAALFSSRFPLHYYHKDKFAFLRLKPFARINCEKLFREVDKKIVKSKKVLIKGSDSQLQCVTASNKNAKIAGIGNYVNFSRIDIEWLDTKFKQNTMDKIVTHPPMPSAHINAKAMEKLYKEFFYHAEFILKKKGKIAMISNAADLLKKAAEQYRFKVIHERSIWHGMQEMKVIVFEK